MTVSRQQDSPVHHQIEQLKSPDQQLSRLVVHSPHPAIRVPSQHTQNCLKYPLGHVKFDLSPA